MSIVTLVTEPSDLKPAPDTMEGKTGEAFTAEQLVTMACHAITNTVFVAPDPKPKWFDDLNAKLQAAITLATEWINTIDPKISAEIPLQVINFAPTFVATTQTIQDIVAKNPNASGKDNPYVLEIKNIIAQVLVPAISETISNVDDASELLGDWGTRLQAAHDALASGATNIQSAEIELQVDIDKMNTAISNLKAQIDGENKAISASAAAIGVGIFTMAVGLALAVETFGAGLAVAGIGAAGIIGGGVTWGVMQHKINQQFDDIAKDQQALASDKRQIVALQGLQLASNGAVSNLELASSSLSKLRTQWQVFDGELKGVLAKLDAAEEAISTIVQGIFTNAAIAEWHAATDTANALANRKLIVETKVLSMDGSVAAAA